MQVHALLPGICRLRLKTPDGNSFGVVAHGGTIGEGDDEVAAGHVGAFVFGSNGVAQLEFEKGGDHAGDLFVGRPGTDS